MIRTTPELVMEIVKVNPDIELDPFIAVASSMVDEVSDRANPSLSEDRLTLIETWLSAHFYCIRDPRTTSERAGPVSASYQGQTGMKLLATTYGQQAMVLDTSGILKALSNSKSPPKVTWLGTDY